MSQEPETFHLAEVPASPPCEGNDRLLGSGGSRVRESVPEGQRWKRLRESPGLTSSLYGWEAEVQRRAGPEERSSRMDGQR